MALETIFRTSDGREFTNFTDARIHENHLQGIDDLKYYTVSFLFEGKRTYTVISKDEAQAIIKARAYLDEDILNSLNHYNIISNDVIKITDV